MLGIPFDSEIDMSFDPMRDNRFMVMQQIDVWDAFLSIASKLMLACAQDSGFNIVAPVDSLPPSLAPTLQQRFVPHKPYVDMLPVSDLLGAIHGLSSYDASVCARSEDFN